MIGEAIVALLCVLILVVWIHAMATVNNTQRLARLERIIARANGYETESEEISIGDH